MLRGVIKRNVVENMKDVCQTTYNIRDINSGEAEY